MKILAVFLLSVTALLCADDYSLGPDSQRHPSVPQGSVTKHTWSTSKIFPGTVRDYWVYVPQQYKAGKAACVMFFLDGAGYISDKGNIRGPVVLDNLIAKGDMPVTVAIFVDPGVLPALSDTQQNRYNRSLEYDGLGDRNARFLIDEILPEVRKDYNLSTNPDDFGIGGQSSGGIAAFTAAWERPDVFRRVLTFVGSFTNLRGGDAYPGLIRKTEPKPLRIFQQDGSNDQNIYSGSWFMANQDVAMALAYAGYDARFVVGTEGHNMKQGAAILPDALRWLWRDYGTPIVASAGGKGNRHFITDILDPGKGWELVGSGYKATDGPAVDKDGNVYYSDNANSKIYKASAADGKVTVYKDDQGGSGMMFGGDGTLYACQNKMRRVVAFAPDGSMKVLAEGVDANDLAVGLRGDVYFTDSPGKKVWRISPSGDRKVVQEGLAFPNGIRFSPDHSLLIVDDMNNRWAWSFQVQPDGSLSDGEAFYHLEVTDENSMSGADGMTLDTEGYLYVTTRLGIQVCDQPGRGTAIISKPAPKISNITFGGPDMQYIYVTAADKVYRRHLRRKGIYPWQPVKPPRPQL